MARGRFITFEGIEGCGKSSQARRLAARLAEAGLPVLSTREPGGTPAADAIRAVLLSPVHSGMPAEAELLLYGAARCDHVQRVVRPALEAGTHVVCDRFSDSTRAYQHAGRDLPASMVEAIDLIARGTLVPDVTLLLDLPAEEGLTRAHRRNAGAESTHDESRIDAEGLGFHRKIRSAFLRLAGQEPHRIWVIDASGTQDDVAARVESVVRRTLPELLGGAS